MKVDRHIPVHVDRYVKVDRPYEVIKYVDEPFLVKVEKQYHVPIETKVSVPQPIVEIEPIIPEPEHIQREAPHQAGWHFWYFFLLNWILFQKYHKIFYKNNW